MHNFVFSYDAVWLSRVIIFLFISVGKKHKMNSIFTAYFDRINYSCLSVGEMQGVILTKSKSEN